MPELTLTGEEQSMLTEILEKATRDVLIEGSRTEAISYRKYVQHKEHVVTGLLDKLKKLADKASATVVG